MSDKFVIFDEFYAIFR